MAEQFQSLSQELRTWIEEQPVFFVGSAARSGRVNVSPKGMDSLRILGPDKILWLNLTGSGNETAAHLRDVNRLTIMWCAFTGPPRILRVYGSAKAVHPHDANWKVCTSLLPPNIGARQYFEVDIELVQTSCGYAVPLMDYVEDRSALTKWSEKKGQSGVEEYWLEKNQQSIDGFHTGISPES